MCGIAGIVSKNKELVSEDKLQQGVRCLRHRGPEAESTWLNREGTAALGHQRLRIIDLSMQAAQPMHYAGRFTIIHNGEIFNYTELRVELQKLGYSFSSHSDTEVILASYKVWGSECLQRFNGMFAFAVWDEEEQKLFIARDRMGEKPLFYSYDGDRLVFASEMKALWSLGVPKEVNTAMLYNFLTIGYTSNPGSGEETFYNGIYKLPAGHFLEFTLSDEKIVQQNYWTVYPEEREDISDDEAIEQFRDLFASSIRKRLRSDVAIGTSLSGGLDSSSVVAFCDREKSEQYSHKCFTAVFPGYVNDERKWAEKIVSRFGLEHHLVEVGDEDITELMQRVMEHQEEPFGSASVLAQYKVFEKAKREGVTVLLDGQGADELLGGYHRYYKWYWQELYRQKKLGSSKELESAKALGIQESFGLKNKLAALMPQFAGAMLQSRKAKSSFRQQDLNRDFAFSHMRDSYYSLPLQPHLNGALYFNTFLYGLEELLRVADRNSMAHATELRLPFLDHELVEFLFTLPSRFKIRAGWTKWILRNSVRDLLPEEITWRRDKTGFEPPQKKWMEGKGVQDAIQSAKDILVNQQVLSSEVLHKKIQPHNAYAAESNDWKYWSAAWLFNKV